MLTFLIWQILESENTQLQDLMQQKGDVSLLSSGHTLDRSHTLPSQDFEDERSNFKEMINSLLQQLSLQQQSLQQPAAKGKKGSTSAPIDSNPTNDSSLLSGLLGSNKKTMEKIAQLKQENQELRSAEKLRPQLLDLQQQLVATQTKLSEQQSYYEAELEQLSEHNMALSQSITTMKQDYEQKVEELKQQIIIIKQLTERNKYLESESRQLLIDLDEAKYEIEQIRFASVDPLAIDELQKKIEQLEGKTFRLLPHLS
jgi:chromosome segregation ATPase